MQNDGLVPVGLPLIAYAEPLCRSARVLVVSSAALTVSQAALERGARQVHVFERDAARRSEAEIRSPSNLISFSAPEAGLREGIFDLIVWENLATERDRNACLRLIGRLLAPRGVALIAAPNPEARHRVLTTTESVEPLDYYGLYDAVSGVLPHVRMLGQVPFLGVSLVDFAAEGDPEPTFDASLVPARAEEPDTFVAVASRHPRALDGYLVVQLPFPVAPALGRRVEDSAPVETGPARGHTPTKAQRLLRTEDSRLELRSSAQSKAADPRPPSTPKPPDAGRAEEARFIAKLKEQLARQEAWIVELEGRAAIADQRADAAESELDLLRETHANREQLAGAELALLRREKDEAQAEISRTRSRANDLSDLLELQQAELASLREDTSTESDVHRLESQLKEQGLELRRLEEQLRLAERTARALIRKLEAATLAVPSGPTTESRAVPPGPPATDIALLDRLVQAEAELVTLRWTVSMLSKPREAPPRKESAGSE